MLAVLAYLATGAACLTGWSRDVARDAASKRAWALSLTGLAIAGLLQVTGTLDALAQAARIEAYGAGWYRGRREYQEIAVVGVALAFVVAVLVVISMGSKTRRSHTLLELAVLALLAYEAVAAVSLHQIDVLLYRNHVLGFHRGALVEGGLLAIISGIALATGRRPNVTPPHVPPPGTEGTARAANNGG